MNHKHIPTRAYVGEEGVIAFCQTTGIAVRPRDFFLDGYALWWKCPLCVAGAKWGDYSPQAHVAVWLNVKEMK